LLPGREVPSQATSQSTSPHTGHLFTVDIPSQRLKSSVAFVTSIAARSVFFTAPLVRAPFLRSSCGRLKAVVAALALRNSSRWIHGM
jgi:hypothetical protein